MSKQLQALNEERWRLKEQLYGRPSDWLPKLWRGFSSQTPLLGLEDALIRATRDDGVHIAVTGPVRHGKSFLWMGGSVRWLSVRPGENIMIAGHSSDFIERMSAKVRDAAVRAGLKLRRGSNALNHWELTNGASLTAAGVGAGGLTGSGASLLICDDLFATREAAESQHERDRVYDWLMGTALSRLTPTGSCISIGARWHLDDVIGRLSIHPEWEYIAEPAIKSDGTALWPEGGWDLDKLEATRKLIGDYDFSSLFLCNPIPKGGAMCSTAPATYTAIDLAMALKKGARIVVSVDPSTGTTKGDYSAIATMALLGSGADTRGWLMHMIRERLELPALVKRIAWAVKEFGASLVLAEAVAGFAGVPQALAAMDRSLRIVPVKPKGDKATRASSLFSACSSGRFLVPAEAVAWKRDFLQELLSFPMGKHDDQVDACSQAINLHALSRGMTPEQRIARGRRMAALLPFG